MIIKINQRHEYKGTKTYFLLLPNYEWMYILIMNGEPYTASFRFKPKFKKRVMADKSKLEQLYTPQEIRKILDRISKAAETTVDVINMENGKR